MTPAQRPGIRRRRTTETAVRRASDGLRIAYGFIWSREHSRAKLGKTTANRSGLDNCFCDANQHKRSGVESRSTRSTPVKSGAGAATDRLVSRLTGLHLAVLASTRQRTCREPASFRTPPKTPPEHAGRHHRPERDATGSSPVDDDVRRKIPERRVLALDYPCNTTHVRGTSHGPDRLAASTVLSGGAVCVRAVRQRTVGGGRVAKARSRSQPRLSIAPQGVSVRAESYPRGRQNSSVRTRQELPLAAGGRR